MDADTNCRNEASFMRGIASLPADAAAQQLNRGKAQPIWVRLRPSVVFGAVSRHEAAPSRCRTRTRSPLLSFTVTAHESDALPHLGGRVLPVVFILEGDIAFEILGSELLQDFGDTRNAG